MNEPKTTEEILKLEFESLIKDIKKVYNASGKRVSGQFEKGLNLIPEPNRMTLEGYGYLAGRGSTKNGHKEGTPYLVEAILEWINRKGIRPREANMTASSLAWAIATKIHREGTNKNYHLKIYEQVVTPERIQTIMDKVTQINVGLFVDEVTAEMKLLVKNI